MTSGTALSVMICHVLWHLYGVYVTTNRQPPFSPVMTSDTALNVMLLCVPWHLLTRGKEYAQAPVKVKQCLKE